MSEASAFEKALVVVEWPQGAPPPVIRCPITGSVVSAGYDPVTGSHPEDFDEPDGEHLPTLAFTYLQEIGEFSYIRDSLQEAIDAKRSQLEDRGEDTEDVDDFEILSNHLDSVGAVPLIFEIRTSGFACGPIESSVYVGLDLFRPFDKSESGINK